MSAYIEGFHVNWAFDSCTLEWKYFVDRKRINSSLHIFLITFEIIIDSHIITVIKVIDKVKLLSENVGAYQ